MTRKNYLPVILYFFLSILIIFQISSCRKKTESPAPAEELESVITFISGEASILSDGSSAPASIGDRLKQGNVLKTAPDSYLELLIDNKSIIRMEGDTELAINRLSSLENRADIGFSLISGTVLSKVEKLLTDEKFTVKTASAAFGVRGTEFLVSSGETAGGSPMLAVRSGSIQLLPYPDEVERLKEKLDTGNGDIAAVLRAVEENFPLVEAGNEITLDPGSLDKVRLTLAEAEKTADDLKTEKISAEDASALLRQAAAAVSAEAEKAVLAVKEMSPENSGKLKITDSMFIKGAGDDFAEIIIKVEPDGSKIYFDDNFAGFTSVSALFSRDRILKVTAEKEGFVPFEKEIAVSEITGQIYIIKLEPAEPEKGYAEISVTPSDAEIYIGNNGPFKSTYRGSFDPGEKLKVSIKKKEYRQEDFEIDIKKGVTEKRRINLQLLLVPYSFETGFQRVDSIAQAGSGYYALAGDSGLFSVISSEGKTVYTSSEPLDDGPVFSGGKLAFVSGSTLKALDSSDWQESGALTLENSIYRKPVAAGDNIFINSGDSVLKIDGKQFALSRKIKVPDTIVSNPLPSGDMLLTVTDKGVLQIFGAGDTPVSSIPVSMGNPVGMTGAADRDTVYFAGTLGTISAVDIKTGKFLWSGSFEPAGEGVLPGIIASGDGIAVLSGNILKFFKADGVSSGERAGVNSFCRGELGTVYASMPDGVITLYDIASGKALKKAETGLPLTALTYRDGKIHAAGADGKYSVINPEAFGR